MNSKRRKRLRFHNQDKDNFCMPNLLNSHSGYGKQNGKATAEVIDFSDAFALRNLLENLDGGKYGSVTKEYERIHAQRMQVINFFSALRSSLVNGCSNPESKSFQGGLNTNSDPSTCPNQVESARHSNGYVAQNVIDLDVDSVATVAEPTNDHVQDLCREPYEGAPQQSVPSMPHLPSSHLSLMGNKTSDVTGVTSDLPEKKDGNNNRSVIILESDEEGDDHLGKNWSSKSEYEAGTFEKCLESQLQLCLRQAKISSQDSHFNQLVPYDQQYAKADRYVAGEVDWQPSIQYEKVVLKNVPEQRPSHGHVVLSNVSEQRPTHNNVVSRNVSEQRPTHGHVGEKDMQNKKNESRRHKRKEGESLYSGANLDKEAAKSPSPISPMASHGHSLSIESHNKYDPETPKSDGFESHNKYAPETPKSDGFESHNKYAPETPKSDGLEDLWKDMSLAMECSKNVTSDGSAVVQKEDDCNHSFVLEDDLGLVCRVCGVIQKSIETIFDNQWIKGTRSTRTYIPSSRSPNDLDEKIEYSGPKFSEDDLTAAEISVHPRHMKQMKPHQLEGFSFLVRNLVTDKPQGCILAHAPGSGKTFMLISFIQSFFAKYPHARPLVVLPKGILPTWKREFQRWQVEDIPLYDFYSSKADSRFQQLDVLKSWEESKSILFLGYKQFTTIVCCGTTCKVTSACQERLLKVPSLLILDEGHTPRNVDTDVLNSLAKVQTPRKVVLSGTLFQNHVREVFNILDLVRPNFLKMESSRVLVKRVLSRVHIPGRSRMPIKGSTSTRFYDLVEETLQNDDNYKRKITVIQDLRELTQNVLHYYKGDFLEELPGLVDFTVLLNLTDKQKEIVQRKLKRSFVGKFKKNSVGNAVYIHPYLKDIADNAASDRGSVLNDDKIDNMLDSLDVRDGVKTKFFLNILSMTEAAGEKLLAFSQYLLPMKFLERVIIRVKGWRVGKEIFMITGDSSTEDRERSMDQFNNSPDAKVLFGSIKACGEGISLVGASRVVILDVHLNPSVTRQAIGRVFRPGQEKKVYTYRLVAADSPEEEDHTTSFRKELTSKMWFEWCEYSGLRDFELEEIGISDCEDTFLESPILAEDVKILYRR